MKSFKILTSKYFTQKVTLGELLKKVTNMETEILADAAHKGSVWLQKGGRGKTLRSRSLDLVLNPTDLITFFYDHRVLAIPELAEAVCIYENKNYGVWIKPAGVVPQGTQAGDHSSLLRYVEIQKNKEVYLIHRLDRETEGLMIIGYNSQAAAILGELFQKHKIKKIYEAVVLGEIAEGYTKTINESLDGKEAISHIKCLKSTANRSLLEVEIETGRLHQIRRHLASIDHPVMGDPKYGKGNKNREGLKLFGRISIFS